MSHSVPNPCAKSAAHTHTHKRQIKQCLQKIPTVLLAVADVMKWKDGQDQQKLFTSVEAYICIIRTLTWASHSGALSIASCAKPVFEDLSPTLPAPFTHKFLTIFFFQTKSSLPCSENFLRCLFTRQSLLFCFRGADKLISLFHAAGGLVEFGVLLFVSWLTLLRVWNMYPCMQWNVRRKGRDPFISISSGRAGLCYSLV